MLKIRLSTGKDPDDWMTIIKMEKKRRGKTWKTNKGKKQTKKRGEGKQIRKT